jgi:hypothetical protein
VPSQGAMSRAADETRTHRVCKFDLIYTRTVAEALRIGAIAWCGPFVVEMDRVVASEAGVKFGRSLSRCRVSHSLNDSIQLSLDFCI